MGLPAKISLQDIEAFADQNPDLYRVLSGIGLTLNDVLRYVGGVGDSRTASLGPPAGPRNLEVASVGSTVIVTWINDSSANTITGYKIFRAAAGTRNSPTSPTFVDGKFIGSVLACDVCLGTQGSAYKYLDRDFAIANMDQSNPARFAYWVTSLDSNNQESMGVPATNSPIEIVTNGPGDQSNDLKDSALNKLYNPRFKSRVTTASLLLPQQVSISAATNASPIQITTSGAHGLVTGDDVLIFNCQGNTAANGYWVVVRIDNFNFTLTGSTGNGAYTAFSGHMYAACGGGRPPGEADANGNLSFRPWEINAGAPEFYSNGAVATGEIRLPAPASGNSVAVMQRSFGIITPGARLTFSVYMRMPVQATDMTITIQIDDGGGVVLSKSFSSSLLSTTYKRVVFNAAPSGGAWGSTADFMVTARTNSGTGRDVFIYKPMVNMGDVPAGWTDVPDVDKMPVIAFETTPSWSRDTATVTFRDATAPYA